MKKLLAVIMASVMSISLAACGGEDKEEKTKIEQILENGYITMATSPDFAPSEFKNPETGEVLGTDIEYGKMVAEYISEKYGKPVELKIEEMDFQACQVAVATNAVDFSISGFAETPERAENYICAGPYAVVAPEDDTYHGALVKKGVVLKTAEDFKGLKVGAQQASLQYNLTMAQLPVDEMEDIEFVKDLSQGALMVATGKIDALMTDSGAGELLASTNKELEMAEFKFEFTSEGNCALVNKNETELGALITEALLDADAKTDYSEMRREYAEMAKSLGVEVED